MNPHSVYRPLKSSSALRMNDAETTKVTAMKPTVLATSSGPGNAVFLNSSKACSRKVISPTGSMDFLSSSESSSSGLKSMGLSSGSPPSKMLMSSVGLACFDRALFSAALIASAVATDFSTPRSVARERIRSFMDANSPLRALKAASSWASMPEVRSRASASASACMSAAAWSNEDAPSPPPPPSFSESDTNRRVAPLGHRGKRAGGVEGGRTNASAHREAPSTASRPRWVERVIS
mmetsp:Transcript_10955/g.22930  ORF Transcript_10955/g.22930 Transcript_10955/m.22930 type:complete len:236 (+) Transcript_10955:445-1152(+)